MHKGKREATDAAQVDSKGHRMTQQWRIVNAIFSIKIKVQCLRGLSLTPPRVITLCLPPLP